MNKVNAHTTCLASDARRQGADRACGNILQNDRVSSEANGSGIPDYSQTPPSLPRVSSHMEPICSK
jgi:hypothetical protein